MEKQWEDMSADERQEAQLQKWISPEGVEFASPEAEKAFKERATRLKDAIQMKKLPDRVPVFTTYGFYPAVYAGITPQEVPSAVLRAFRKGNGQIKECWRNNGSSVE